MICVEVHFIGSPKILRASDLSCGSDAAAFLLKLVSHGKLSCEQAISLALEYHPTGLEQNLKELAKDLVRKCLVSFDDAIDAMWDLRHNQVTDINPSSCNSPRLHGTLSLSRKKARNNSGTRRWPESSTQDVVVHHQERKPRKHRSSDDSDEIRERLYSNRSIESTTDSLMLESANRFSVTSEVSAHGYSMSSEDKKLKSE